ncbi:hypothetical protein T484DRAFT_1777525 [Baffinella frigidus]|nr:hypothetical protein T484DRAFT_1777525 [Cryptophyta sp. CCMP2293]
MLYTPTLPGICRQKAESNLALAPKPFALGKAESKAALAPKPFALGFRIEHPQAPPRALIMRKA